MVKKGSFFARLADRWRSGSGVRVEMARDGAAPRSARPQAAARAESLPPRAEPQRKEAVRPEPAPELPGTAFAAEARSTRKLSDKEEAMVALGSHFQELAQLMRGVHTRMDSQLGRLVETATALQSLPALSNQQLELMRGIAGHMERQNTLGEQIARSLHGMPEMMKSVEAALQRAAQSDERTAATMREFQGTMDRIHAAMGRMVEHSEMQAKAAQSLASQREESLQQIVRSVEDAQNASVRELKQVTDQSLQSLRRTHEDQSNRLQRVVQEHASWNKAVLAVLGVVALGMAATLVVLFLK